MSSVKNSIVPLSEHVQKIHSFKRRSHKYKQDVNEKNLKPEISIIAKNFNVLRINNGMYCDASRPFPY